MAEHISIEQLFEEELAAVTDMREAMELIRADMSLDDPELTEITASIVCYEQTEQYLSDRLKHRVPPRWLKSD